VTEGESQLKPPGRWNCNELIELIELIELNTTNRRLRFNLIYLFNSINPIASMPVKSDNPARHFALAFLIALVVYTVFYHGIEHRRTRKGPWEVTFTHTPAGDPAIFIVQPALAISNVQITFAGANFLGSNALAGSQMTFAQPRPVPYEVPFGQCLFMDTTFLPGTVTFQLCGHEIQLLPRVLTIDRQERPWRPGEIRIPSSRQQPVGD
jgi:hypothetical protein